MLISRLAQKAPVPFWVLALLSGSSVAGILAFLYQALVGNLVANIILFLSLAAGIATLRMPLPAWTIPPVALTLGAFAIFPAGSASQLVFLAGIRDYGVSWGPPIEEAMKAAGVIGVALNLRRFGRDKEDTLVLLLGAVFSGLAFGFFETAFLYRESFVVRTFTSIPAHSLWTLLVGVGVVVGLLRSVSLVPSMALPLAAYVASSFLHALWNLQVFPRAMQAAHIGAFVGVLTFLTWSSIQTRANGEGEGE